jgi:Putative DNA-binding domain
MKPVIPEWLESFESQFSTMLRTPLARDTGTLCANTDQFPSELVRSALPGSRIPAQDRLAVYNRQYWFRLFGVLQNDFRLVCALLGPWKFNELASAFLLDAPPTGHDLARAADGFSEFVRAFPRKTELTVPPLALAQAAQIDEGFRRIFWAPRQSPESDLKFRQLSAQALVAGRLRPSGRFFLVEEDWSLLALRHSLASAPDRKHTLPARNTNGRGHAAIVQHDKGPQTIPLHSVQAKLYTLLVENSLTDALSILEAKISAAEAPSLARNVRNWLAESVNLGFWTGVDT